MTTYLYSGYIDCGGSEADYEFECEFKLDALDQLTFLMESGILQIMDNEPEEVE